MFTAPSNSMRSALSSPAAILRSARTDAAVRDLATLVGQDAEMRRLCDILSIPSWSGHEHALAHHAAERLREYGCRVTLAPHGNVFAVKGKLQRGEAFPAFTAHLDTVFH